MKDVTVTARIQMRKDERKVAYKVLSSNGDTTHTVCLYEGAVISCDCKGWQFKRSCRHAAAVGMAESAHETLSDYDQWKRDNGLLNWSSEQEQSYRFQVELHHEGGLFAA